MIKPHWNYFIAIEKDLHTLSQYIDFDVKNFECFSVEIAKIILSSTAEVDVVCKQICKKLNPQSSASSINQYRNEITVEYPDIHNFGVLLPRYGINLKPWEKWCDPKNNPPPWWTAYNKVKHHRAADYHRANLENAINSVAGLFVMVIHLYKEQSELGELAPPPQLFRVEDKYFGGVSMGGYDHGFRCIFM